MSTLLPGFALLIGSCIIGLTATFRHWYVQGRTRAPDDGCFVGCGNCLRAAVIWLLAAVAGLFFLVFVAFRTSYYDYFVLGLFGYTLFVVWTTAMLGGAIAARIDRQFQSTPAERRSLLILFLICWLFCAGSAFTVPATLTQQAVALLHGPELNQGYVTRTMTGGGRDPTADATIDGVRYEIPDRGWFWTLRRGERVQFLHDPARTVAFPPGRAQLTPLGVTTSGIGAACLLVTLGFVIQGLALIGQGLRHQWRRQRTRRATAATPE